MNDILELGRSDSLKTPAKGVLYFHNLVHVALDFFCELLLHLRWQSGPKCWPASSDNLLE